MPGVIREGQRRVRRAGEPGRARVRVSGGQVLVHAQDTLQRRGGAAGPTALALSHGAD